MGSFLGMLSARGQAPHCERWHLALLPSATSPGCTLWEREGDRSAEDRVGGNQGSSVQVLMTTKSRHHDGTCCFVIRVSEACICSFSLASGSRRPQSPTPCQQILNPSVYF